MISSSILEAFLGPGLLTFCFLSPLFQHRFFSDFKLSQDPPKPVNLGCIGTESMLEALASHAKSSSEEPCDRRGEFEGGAGGRLRIYRFRGVLGEIKN